MLTFSRESGKGHPESVLYVCAPSICFNVYITLCYSILSVNTHFNGLLNPDLPLKSTVPFGAKITRADSTLGTASPPLFPDLVSQSGLDYLLYYLRTC